MSQGQMSGIVFSGVECPGRGRRTGGANVRALSPALVFGRAGHNRPISPMSRRIWPTCIQNLTILASATSDITESQKLNELREVTWPHSGCFVIRGLGLVRSTYLYQI